MTRLMAVAGAAPGAGKSTLCAGLADWLAGCGLRVDHFHEEEVLTRAVFAPLAREFASAAEVQPATLLETTAALLGRASARGMDVVLTDALVPFVPSLLGWGYREATIAGFLHALAVRLEAFAPVVVYLDDDPAAAVARAVAREGPAWQDWLVGKLSTYPVEPPISDLETACTYLRHERDTTLRLLADLPWQLVRLPHCEPPSAAALQQEARTQLAELLDTPAGSSIGDEYQ